MEFLVNDLSMDGQFGDLSSFRQAVATMMRIRLRIREHGYRLACHRGLLAAKVTPDLVMQQAVQEMPRSAQRALLQWFTKQGPHWEDDRRHCADDWLEVDEKLVTDSAVGEAAACVAVGLLRELVSFTPSSWTRSPLKVRWMRNDESFTDVIVVNHWTLDSVQRTLTACPKPIGSWTDLAARSIKLCSRLNFAKNAFAPLRGQPFSPGAADRVRVLLNVLNRMKGCFAEDGVRTIEGHRLYQDHFTGDRAWFSDSSETEKRNFRQELTFRHPKEGGRTLSCSWHGKVKTPQLRIHFSWPIAVDVPLYVLYVGPKITKR